MMNNLPQTKTLFKRFLLIVMMLLAGLAFLILPNASLAGHQAWGDAVSDLTETATVSNRPHSQSSGDAFELTASDDSPTAVGQATTLTATLMTSTVLFTEDFEALSDFDDGFGYYVDDDTVYTWQTNGGLWNLAEPGDYCPPPGPNDGAAAYFGESCNYGVPNDDYLAMVNPVSLPDAGDVTLSFRSYEDLDCGWEGGGTHYYNGMKSAGLAHPLVDFAQQGCTISEQLLVEVGTDDGEGWTWTLLAELDDNSGTWYTKTLSLTDYLGEDIRLRFYFDADTSGLWHDARGWLVDNVSITSLTPATNTGAVTYTWSFGDGAPALSNGAVVTHPYQAAGAYTAVVTANTSSGIFTASALVDVQTPVSGLSITSDSPTALGQATTLTTTISAGSAVSYTWDLGDGALASGDVTSHTYASTGTYTVIVTAANAVSLETSTATVEVKAALTGLSLSSDSPTPLGQTTTLTASFGMAAQIFFEDFETLEELSEGGFGYQEGEGYVKVWDSNYSGEGQLWHLVDTGDTCSPPGPNDSAVAYFGDDNNCNYAYSNDDYLAMADPVTLPESGQMILSFRSYENLDCDAGERGASLDVPKVTGLASPMPDVFRQGGCTVLDQLWVQVATFDGEGWSWNTLAELDNNGGVWHTQTLSLADYLGQDIRVRFYMDANPGWNEGLGWMVDDVSIQQIVNESVSSGEVTYTWDFDDETSAQGSQAVVTHTYQSAGTYTATVTASNGASVTTAAASIIVEEPVAGLSLNSDSPTVLGQATTLTATVSQGNNLTYTWDLGDGSTLLTTGGDAASTSVVTQTYIWSGAYTVVVTAENSVGVQTTTTTVEVKEPLLGLTVSNDSPTAFGQATTLTATAFITANLFSEDFETVEDFGDGFGYYGDEEDEYIWYTNEGLWTLNGPADNCLPPGNSSTVAYFGHYYDCNYNNPGDDYLVMANPVTLPDSSEAILSFRSYEDLDCEMEPQQDVSKVTGLASPLPDVSSQEGCRTSDRLLVEIGTFDGEGWNWDLLGELDNNGGGWYAVSFSLADYLGQDIRIRFYFDASSGWKEKLGWMVDNVAIQVVVPASEADGVTYTWDLGDGTPVFSNGAVVSHTYPTVGSYTVVVTAGNEVSTLSAVAVVTVEEAIAGLSAANNSPTRLGMITSFTASITAGTNVSYTWDFGNGEIGSGQTSSHSYDTARIYTVTVTASNPVSVLSDTTTVTVEETIGGLISADDSPTALGQATTLSATITAGSNVRYSWNFDDGATGSRTVTTHTYATAGSYTAVVTASNAVSLMTDATTIIIEETVSGLSAANDSPTAIGQATTLSATITAGTDVSYAWDLGDGTTASGAVASHTYSAPGTYTAVVTAGNAVSLMTASATVTVEDTISGLSLSSDSPTLQGEPTALTSTVEAGSNVRYDWYFGDGTAIQNGEATETHTYATAGTYTTVVTASNSVNLVTATTAILVIGPPDPDQSEVTANKDTAAADGSDTIFIQITLRAAAGYAVPNQTVVLTSTAPISLTQPPATDANGQTSGQASNSQAGPATIEAWVDGTLVGTITVTFEGPDLSVSKSGPPEATAGFPLTYTLNVENSGLLTAANVLITDSLPAGLNFASQESNGLSFGQSGSDLTWEASELGAGQSLSVTLVVTVDGSLADGAVITNVVTAATETAELNTANNTDEVETSVIEAVPEMAIEPDTSVSDDAYLLFPVKVGETGTISATIHSVGTAPLLNLNIAPPPHLPWISVTPTGAAQLNPDQSLVFTMTAVTGVATPTGRYWDVITVTTDNHSLGNLKLGTYVHPDLVNLNVSVTNDLSETVMNALVSMTKTTPSVFFRWGTMDSYYQGYFNYQTDESGAASIPEVEVGVYTYLVQAEGHLPVSGVLTVTTGTLSFEPPPLRTLPSLSIEPNPLSVGVVAGGTLYRNVLIRNNGPGYAGNFAVETSADLSWLSGGWPNAVATTTLAPGEAISLTLLMAPPENETTITYEEFVTVTAQTTAGDMDFEAILAARINVTTSHTADFYFEVTETGGSPSVSGATIWLINQTGRIVRHPGGEEEIVYDSYSQITPADGLILFEALPLGEYNYIVEADGYYLETGTVEVLPVGSDEEGGEQASLLISPPILASPLAAPLKQWGGGSNGQRIELRTDHFTYDWTVMEIPGGIQDTYAITVEISYEAEILTEPNLYVSPMVVCPGSSSDFIVVNIGSEPMSNIQLTSKHEGLSFSASIPPLDPGEAHNGSVWVSGSSDAAPAGSVEVSSSFTVDGQSHPYQSENESLLQCSGAGSGWSWSWGGPGSRIIGHNQATQPQFPGNPSPPSGPSVVRDFEKATLNLSGDATLERQAFLATLHLISHSDETLEDMRVDIGVQDQDGLYVVGGFAVTPTLPTDLEDLSPGHGLSEYWTLIPGELGIQDPDGVVYYVRSQIIYTYSNAVYTVTTLPAQITVYPQPRVKLSYTHNQPDANGSFYLQVKAENLGYGIAHNLTLDLSDINLVLGQDGDHRSLVFDLQQTTIDDQNQPNAFIFRFGDIQPNETKVGRWEIDVHSNDYRPLIDPRVTNFGVSCTHLPYQGVELSDLLFCGDLKQVFLANECPFCGINGKQVGGPISTANGNYSYSQSTPAIPTVGDPLKLNWTYNSLGSGLSFDVPVISSTLGTGWTHNYDLALDLADIESPSHIVRFKAFHGSPLQFEYIKGQYRPAPGVHGSLTNSREAWRMANGEWVSETFVLTAANQATYIFNNDGRLVEQFDPQGNTFTFTYNISGNLARVAEPVSGRYLDFAYNAEGRLSSVSDPISRATGFAYDAQSHLTAITDTRNQVWQYDYTQLSGGQYVLSKVTDPDGRTVEQTGFDELGRAITQTYRGEDLSIAYHDDGRRIITDGAGRETYHIYNNQNWLVSTFDALTQTNVFVTDEYGNQTYSQDKMGNPTHYARNPLGYTTAISDALGNLTLYEYDGRNNMTLSTDALGNVTTYLYDGQSNLISSTNALGHGPLYTYNSQGQTTSVTDPSAGSGQAGNTTSYGYDALGQRTVITDALGNATHYEYDDVGRLITMTDSLGKMTVNRYDGGDNLIRVTENVWAGQPQNYLSEYNLVAEYGYDGAGRQTLITDTLGRVNRSEYDDAGRLLRSIQNVHPTVSEQNYQNEYNLVTEYVYDEAGNLVETINTAGRVSRTEYDALNRTERSIVNYVDGVYDPAHPDEDIITRYEYDANGNLVSAFDLLERETRSEYDELNRVARSIVNYQDGVFNSTQPDEDLITAYTYNETGNQKTVANSLGRVTRYTYDELNRVVAVTNPLSGTTLTAYDEAGNRATTTNAEGRATTYSYDTLNRVVTTTNALGGKNITVYDEAGRRAATIDANGNAATFQYDSLGRLISTTDAESQTTTIQYNAQGQRTSVTDAEGNTTTFTYNSLGRTLTTTNSLSGTVGVSYNALGNRLSATDANGHTTTFEYDALNRLTRTTNPNGLTAVTVYDGLGRRLSVTNAASETTEFEYDEVDRLILTRDPLGNESEYRYNGAGSRVAMIDAEDVETRYEYDDLGRLVSVIENYEDGVYDPVFTDRDIETTYTYNAVGNRLSVTDPSTGSGQATHTTTYVYDSLNRRVESSNPLGHATRYGYDALGNRTVITDAKGAVTHFSYDDVNRLTSIDYSDSTPDVAFDYNKVGQRIAMSDGTGVTTYTHDALYRLIGVNDGAGQQVGYGYDPVGNRTYLIYPDGREVNYDYDPGNRLDTVTDWNNGQFGYDYDDANRLTGLTLPNGVESSYDYDDAGRLTLLTHSALTETLASYAYNLDKVGNRRVLTETLLAPTSATPEGTYLEEDGLVVMEAENALLTSGESHTWQLKTVQNGYTGTAYLQSLPDFDTLYATNKITGSPALRYLVEFSTPGTYTVWLRGMASSASSDSVYVGLDSQMIEITAFAPRQWDWAGGVSLDVQQSGLYTVNVRMREDGLRVDRLLLTTDTAYLPADFGPAETVRKTEASTGTLTTLARTIDYDYDDLYRLTNASYTTGEAYQYAYDPVGNRLQQIIDGDTTEYLYDAANRLAAVDDVSYTFDNNGNLLNTGEMTNTWDAANRLVGVNRDSYTLQPIYNGVGDRVGQTVGLTTTYFALDVQGLPEVIYTSDGNAFLHLPGVIVTESAGGERRYLLSDGLGSVRQTTNETAQVVSYHEFDPYGNPVQGAGEPYGFTGEWWESDVELLHLRVRWYLPETGTFLSVDPVESEPPYSYVRGNVVNLVDPSGMFAQECEEPPYDGFVEGFQIRLGGWLLYAGDVLQGYRSWQDIYFSYFIGVEWVFDFEHQEMASFVYAGEAFEPLNLASGSITFYDGQIDGFRNYDASSGVLAYNGPFIGVGNGWGVSYVVGAGTSESTAYPSDNYVSIEKNILDAAKVNIHADKMVASYKGYYLSIGFQGDIGIPTPNLPKLPGWISAGFETTTAIYANSSLPIQTSINKMAQVIESGYDFADPTPVLFNRRYSWWMLPTSKNRSDAIRVLKTYFRD